MDLSSSIGPYISCTSLVLFFNPFLRTPLFLFSYLLYFFFKENFFSCLSNIFIQPLKKKKLKKESDRKSVV